MKTNTSIKIATFVLTVLAWTCSGSFASAKQYTKVVQGREVVVHTSPLPVILHRMVPPQHGRHVTQREIESGKVASAAAKSRKR